MLWLVLLASFLVSTSTPAAVGRVLLGLLVLAHVVECVVFLGELRRAPGPLGRHLAMTMVFGIVYVRELRAR